MIRIIKLLFDKLFFSITFVISFGLYYLGAMILFFEKPEIKYKEEYRNRFSNVWLMTYIVTFLIIYFGMWFITAKFYEI